MCSLRIYLNVLYGDAMQTSQVANRGAYISISLYFFEYQQYPKQKSIIHIMKPFLKKVLINGILRLNIMASDNSTIGLKNNCFSTKLFVNGFGFGNPFNIPGPPIVSIC